MPATLEAPVTDGQDVYAHTPDDHELHHEQPDDTDETLEVLLTSPEPPLALARILGVTLDHITAFLASEPVRHRLAQIEAIESLRRQHADRLVERAARETLARLTTHVSTTPAEARDAQLQQRAATALLRHLKPTPTRASPTSRRRKAAADAATDDARPDTHTPPTTAHPSREEEAPDPNAHDSTSTDAVNRPRHAADPTASADTRIPPNTTPPTPHAPGTNGTRHR